MDEQWGYFENNTLATGFYEWKISQNYFRETDYFQNVVLIDKAFENDLPELIADPNQVMPDVFKRIPAIAKQYVKHGTTYQLVSTANPTTPNAF
ncbi:MAG: hypothetical protein HWD62_11610 [Cyclobacteriaceae bacterium]|nr:MAG: hypothetical protein HWD62_11610 [Cyclobacteriaceae bacterium]